MPSSAIAAAAAYFATTAAGTTGIFVISAKAFAVAAIAATATAVSQQLARSAAKKAAARNSLDLAQDRTVSVRSPIGAHQLIYGRTRAGGNVVYAQTTAGPEGANGYLHMVIVLAAHEVAAIETVLANDAALTLNASGYVTNAYTSEVDLTPISVTLNASGAWVNTNPDQTIVSAYISVDSGTFSVDGAQIFTQVNATVTGGNTATFGAAYANTTQTVYGRLSVSWMRVKKYLGTSTQTADSDLVSESGGAWTSNHRLRGRAYMYVRLRFNAGLFADGVPNFTAIVQGKKVYDPRTATSYNTSNAALVIADYLNTSYGFGAAYGTEIDNTQLAAAANLCEETVSLNGGGTEPRYEIHGTVDTSQRPREVLSKLLTACGGRAVYVGGVWKIIPAAYVTPTLTLDEGDFRSPIQVQTLQSRRDLCNGVKGIFIGDVNQWQPADFPPVVNATYLSEDNSERLWRDIELPYTKSAAAAQRLAKIELERSRQQIAVTVTTSLIGLQLQAGDTVQLTVARFGWSSKVFEVLGWRFDVGADGALGVALELRETASGVYTWASGEQTVVDAAPNTDLPDPFTVAAPTGLTVTSATVVAVDGTVAPRMTVGWTAADDAFVRQGGQVRIEWKRTTASDYLDSGVVRGDSIKFVTPPMPAVAHNIRVRFENGLGAYSAWTAATHTVSGDTTAPGAPTGLTATAAIASIRLSWTNPTADDLAYVEIWEHTSDVRASATKIGEASGTGFVRTGLATGATRFYWVRAVDTSGNVGAYNATAGVSATISAVAATDISVTSLAAINADLGNITAGSLDIGTGTQGLEVNVSGKANAVYVYQQSQSTYGLYVKNSHNTANGGGAGYVESVYGFTVESKLTGDTATLDYAALSAVASTAGGGDVRLAVPVSKGGYAGYANSGTWSPFTGSHDGLIGLADAAEPGDILVDGAVVARKLSDTITVVSRSDDADQHAIGVYVSRHPLSPASPPAALRGSPDLETLAEQYDVAVINAVGEGSINVCGEGGDIAAGHLIVTSSVSGKGMRQADDVVRSYTVARAREAVTFSDPAEVRQIACIYLCG